MKKIMLCLVLMSGAMSAYSNEYREEIFNCVVSADQTSLLDVSIQPLPKKIDFKITVKEVFKKSGTKIVSTSVDNVILGLPQVKHLSKNLRKYSIKFDDLSVEESVEVLQRLGSDQTHLPFGLKFEKLKFKKNARDSYRSQVHFPFEVNDGLSFYPC